MGDLDLTALLMTIFGTFVAGFAGAWAAQAVVIRREDSRALISEIRATNSAVILAVTVANKYLALKEQHIKEVVLRHQADQQAYKEFMKPMPAPGPRVFQIQFDLRTLEPPVAPIDALAHLCFNSMTLPPRPLAAIADLQTAIAALSAALRERVKLIEEHRNRVPPRTSTETTEWYLGLPNAAGHIDQRFQGVTTAIGLYCDDCIFFARLLSDDLAKEGKRLGSEHWWRFQRKVHVRGPADWSRMKDPSLMPSESSYQPWLEGFPSKRPWWKFWQMRFRRRGGAPRSS